MVRDLLVFDPDGAGTDVRLALETVSLLLKRRSIVFLISDFLTAPESYRQAMQLTGRRHDLAAFDLQDPMEREMPDVGIILLEDAETGDRRWVDTGNRAWRREFSDRVVRLEEDKQEIFAGAGVDRVSVTTDGDYVPALAAFFRDRLRRQVR
jgi:uncharacterized protein (DUF58 family)